MSKFKVGDKVVYVNQLCEYAPDDIELGQCYTVDGLLGDRCITLEGVGGMFPAWQEERFELFSEWASHQVPVSTETELALTKIQVKRLQDWKKDALYLLSKTSYEDVIPTTLLEEIDYFLVNNKLEGFYE